MSEGEKMALLRIKLGLSQGAFADMIGMSETAVAMVESGQRKISLAMLGKIAANVPYDDEISSFFDSVSKIRILLQE